jgi:hypothetical protein
MSDLVGSRAKHDFGQMTYRCMQFVVGVAVLLALSGCQTPTGPGQDAAALQALPGSRACVADLPPFGYWKYARDEPASTALPDATIIAGDDGGWCQIRFQHWWGQQPIQAPLALRTEPAHGEALVGSVGTSLRIAYKAAPGFAGSDMFTVHLGGPEPWDIPVHVTVVR